MPRRALSVWLTHEKPEGNTPRSAFPCTLISLVLLFVTLTLKHRMHPACRSRGMLLYPAGGLQLRKQCQWPPAEHTHEVARVDRGKKPGNLCRTGRQVQLHIHRCLAYMDPRIGADRKNSSNIVKPKEKTRAIAPCRDSVHALCRRTIPPCSWLECCLRDVLRGPAGGT